MKFKGLELVFNPFFYNMKIKDLYFLVKKVNVNTTFRIIVQNNDDNIIELLQDQLSHGFIETQGGLNQFQYKNKNYRNYKLSTNARANGFVDLHLTGSFYDGMYLDSKKASSFFIDSNDNKKKKLKDKYGKNIMKLGGKYLVEFTEGYIYPNFIKSLRKQLHL